jgi:hypothetical protein
MEKLVKCYIWSIALYGAQTGTLREVDQKYLEMWCWRMMEKISWTDHVRNKVLQRVKEERNIPHTINRRKVKVTSLFTGHASHTLLDETMAEAGSKKIWCGCVGETAVCFT